MQNPTLGKTDEDKKRREDHDNRCRKKVLILCEDLVKAKKPDEIRINVLKQLKMRGALCVDDPAEFMRQMTAYLKYERYYKPEDPENEDQLEAARAEARKQLENGRKGQKRGM